MLVARLRAPDGVTDHAAAKVTPCAAAKMLDDWIKSRAARRVWTLVWFASEHLIPLAHEFAHALRWRRIDRGLVADFDVADIERHRSMFAALLRGSESWRGIRITEFELRQLYLLRNELNELFGARHAPAAQPINPAPRSQISSNRRT